MRQYYYDNIKNIFKMKLITVKLLYIVEKFSNNNVFIGIGDMSGCQSGGNPGAVWASKNTKKQI